MVPENSVKMPWVVVKLQKELYAFATGSVREMVRFTNVTAMPRMPEYVRGVINLRGSIIPLLDLRMLIGMQSVLVEKEGLIDILVQREQDHMNWLENLKKSVENKTAFTGATDAHKCAFGVWYDNFKTDDLLLQSLLNKFDEPHKAIHEVAIKVKAHEDAHNYDAAFALIEKTRNSELAEMIALFTETREQLRNSNREIVVVLAHEDKHFAVSVDSVESVDMMRPDSFEEPPLQHLTIGSRMLHATAKRARKDDLVFLFDVEKVMSSREMKAVDEAAVGG